MTIGTELRRWRRDADLTLADIANGVGYSVVHISQIERDQKTPPGAATLRKWLRLLGKEDEFETTLQRANKARKSVKLSLDGRSNKVVAMAGTLARQMEGNEIDDSVADAISKLLEQRGKK